MFRSRLIWSAAALLTLGVCAPPRAQNPGPVVPLSQAVASLVGQQIWVYGGGPLKCILSASTTTLSVPLTAPVRVTGAQSAERRLVEIGTNGHLPAQTADHPIVLTLKPEGQPVWVSSSSGSSLAPFESGLEGRSCAEFKVAFVDEEHLNRVLSLTPPPPNVLDAQKRLPQPSAKAPASMIGLTPLQVLWLQGPPDEPLNDVRTLLKAQTWTVFGPPGYGDHVMTFGGGKMVGETFPSQMP